MRSIHKPIGPNTQDNLDRSMDNYIWTQVYPYVRQHAYLATLILLRGMADAP